MGKGLRVSSPAPLGWAMILSRGAFPKGLQGILGTADFTSDFMSVLVPFNRHQVQCGSRE